MPQDARPIVEARNLRRVYSTPAGDVIALDGVSLSLWKGEFVGVMGPSGCGKTTLLNCLSGLDEVTDGEVIVDGAPLQSMSDSDRTAYRASKMGFIFQAFNLLPVFSAVENVELPMLLGGAGAREARSRAREALASVDMAHREDHRPAELSGGEQQRVAVARAVASRPAVLWADEPTGNLDTENAASVMQLLSQLNRELELTILMVTHDSKLADASERLIQMRDGSVVT